MSNSICPVCHATLTVTGQTGGPGTTVYSCPKCNYTMAIAHGVPESTEKDPLTLLHD
jgi:uncharacterized protein YbaR (Trm112 family)